MLCSQGDAFRKRGEILSGLRRKKPPLAGSAGSIGIALLRSHALKAAFALKRSGDFAVACREILLLPECSFELSAAVSCFSLAENGQLQPAAFLRRVSGLLSAHRKGAVCTSPWLHADCTRLALNTMSLPLFRATIRPCEALHCYKSAFREEKSGRENPL